MTKHDLLTEREKTHGKFEHTARISQHLKEVLASCGVAGLSDVHREALEMIMVKIARILAGNEHFKEHFEDIAGYAELGAEECDKHEHTGINQTPSPGGAVLAGNREIVSDGTAVTGQ
jgi:hypothetical protein